MKHNTMSFVTAVCIAGFLFFSVSVSYGSQYQIDWYTIDGGGGISTGGPYVLTGTIGQPDAGWSSGGNYELLGGFRPGGPACIVDFADFARFAEYWLAPDGGLSGDLDKDADVDFEDMALLADYWLTCCPYHWPLR